MNGMRSLEKRLTASDWAPESLFGSGGRMADLFGVMLQVPQLQQNLAELGSEGFDGNRISQITNDWVNGKGLAAIAREHFHQEKDDESGTAALTDACRAIYRTIINSGTWGVSALGKLYREVSGDDESRYSVAQARQFLKELGADDWEGARPKDASLAGHDYKRIWEILSGEAK